MSSTDWIDRLDNEDDDRSHFKEFMDSFYKSRHFKFKGWAETWYWIKGIIEDDEYTEEDSGPLSATDAKKLTNKRTKREP